MSKLWKINLNKRNKITKWNEKNTIKWLKIIKQNYNWMAKWCKKNKINKTNSKDGIAIYIYIAG